MPRCRWRGGPIRAPRQNALFAIVGPMVRDRGDVGGLDVRALADALSVHFPQFADEPYFAECFSEMVEERHAEESLSVTQMVLSARPELLPATIADAEIMAEALDGVWTHLDRIVEIAREQAVQRSSAPA